MGKWANWQFAPLQYITILTLSLKSELVIYPKTAKAIWFKAFNILEVFNVRHKSARILKCEGMVLAKPYGSVEMVCSEPGAS